MFRKNEELKKLAVEYGFRFECDAGIVEKAKTVKVNIPDVVVDVIDPPNYDVLDYMAELVENRQ